MRLIIDSRRRGRLQALIEGEGQDGYRQPEKSDEFEGLHHVNDHGDQYGCVEVQGRGALHCHMLF